jgi:hypothetical protein
MKKKIRFFFISVASLLLILITVISILLWLVFTPERLTPILRKQIDKYITCQSEIGEVELTFFSTFPHFGLKINHFAAINPIAGASNDTLARIDQLVGVIDAAAWWNDKELIITDFILANGTFHVFTDSLGNSNYNIISADTTYTPTAESEPMFSFIDINDIELRNINLHYVDLSLKLRAVVRDLTAKITGTIKNDSISCNVKVSRSGISLEFNGEKYLQDASVQFNMPADVIQSRQFVRLKKASVSINDLKVKLNGTIENDTIHQNIITDIRYEFDSWPVKNILALVPPSFNSYLKGVDAEGLLSSMGSIAGIFNDSVMPLMDIRLLIKKGNLKYVDFPIPMHDINGDITFHSDMKSDSLSFLRIDQFNARTPKSTIKVKGLVNHLFTDTYCKLTTAADLTLEEFNPVVPANMNIYLKGRAYGQIKSGFSLNQLSKMLLEKIKISGSVTLSHFEATYDSITLKTDRSKIEFSLPNQAASVKNTKFAFATILSDNLDASKPESYNASFRNAFLTLETSNVTDTTRIPDIICSFNMDYLTAGMDTMSLTVIKPHGRISVSPRYDKSGQPKIMLACNSDKFEATIGQNTSVVKKINIDCNILNDNSQKDIFLQWLVKGSIEIDQGNIKISGFSYPVEIPAIKMNFEPEALTVKEGRIRIDKSDFQLSGNLRNVLSYFRGDSILRGSFSFFSNTTDVSQLMSLTSGIGNKDSTAIEKTENSTGDTTYTGPYMVPKGIDVILGATIKKATLGIDTATNINGNVRVKDGILLLDEITFTTPAARMQLTAMYRTPRKNHLFLGLDYHMLDVEIGELHTMIPDIDSLMPMLRSFGGKGEFHIAVETYLDSLYNIKKSTLRGASSIKGNDLILMDGETFSEIAKTLKFNKKTKNRVDTLSAEFTIFRDEIDVYPFLIVMDKYKAVVAGRHNFDLSFDYHISVVDSPLPFKLGVDIKGNMDKMEYKLAKCKYAEYYRPVSRRSVENKQLELRKMIRDALTKKVKE